MVLRCATCGRPLDGDLEDEPFGDAGRPICGACNRARNFDVIAEFELGDGRGGEPGGELGDDRGDEHHGELDDDEAELHESSSD